MKSETRQLFEILKIPKDPIECASVDDLARFEKEWIRLPQDYKNFISTFGTGSIDDFLRIFNPSSSNKHRNYFAQAKLQLSVMESVKIPFSLFPEKQGLFPFALTDNGDLLVWKTLGDPENWPIIIFDPRAWDYEIHNMGFSSFLLGIVTKTIVSQQFPDDFPSNHPSFVPAKKAIH